MLKFLAKKVLPVIASNLEFDVDTVQKSTGTFLRVRIECFNFKLLDALVPLSESEPVDVYELAATNPALEKLQAAANKALLEATKGR